jgi:hypothetical protein
LIGILSTHDDEQAFALYRDLETVRAALDLAELGHIEDAARSTSFVVNFADQPLYAVDAMRRAYGLSRIPIAAKMDDGRESPLSDVDLLAIGAALKAVSILTDETSTSTAMVQVGDLKVEVVARLLEPIE